MKEKFYAVTVGAGTDGYGNRMVSLADARAMAEMPG
jgi:hypothetical protein